MMSYEEIVNSLYYTFNNVIKNCFRLDDRNIRKDICILINYVISSPGSHNYFIYRDVSKNKNYYMNDDNALITQRTFLDILLNYATYDEIKYNQREKDSIIRDSNYNNDRKKQKFFRST